MYHTYICNRRGTYTICMYMYIYIYICICHTHIVLAPVGAVDVLAVRGGVHPPRQNDLMFVFCLML